MIIYPKNWKKDWKKLTYPSVDITKLVSTLHKILKKLRISHISYSGGIDSTILLCLLSDIFDEINTYTISSRESHPDIQFARKGSRLFGSKHHEFIVKPTQMKSDRFLGDNAVRQLFENVAKFTDTIICCDGIDEFICGYYEHRNIRLETYTYYLSRLLPDHLTPLDKASKHIKVVLPYLDEKLVSILRQIPLSEKVDKVNRKKIMTSIAKYLSIPEEFIFRNKYGFCDAFIDKNKEKGVR